MSACALVLIPAAATVAELLQPIAGVPALLRLLLCAQRAGVEAILVLAEQPDLGRVREALGQDARLRVRLLWLDDQSWSALLRARPELEKEWLEGDVWVLPGRGLIDAGLLREAVQTTAGCPMTVIAAERRGLDIPDTVFYRVSGPWLRPLLAASGDLPVSSLLTTLPQRHAVESRPTHGLMCVSYVEPAHRAALERGLFKGLQSASDGWVDRYLNRQLSPWFSRWFLRLRLTPNQVTLIALMIGLVAAYGFSRGDWLSGVVGALLLQWSAIIDCCDGEIARLRFLQSEHGYYLDITCDNLVHVAVFAAIAWSSVQTVGHSQAVVLGSFAIAGTLLAFVVVLATRQVRVRQSSIALERLIEALTNRDFSLLLLVCAATGTLGWFLWMLAIGVNLFWPLALALAYLAPRTAHA